MNNFCRYSPHCYTTVLHTDRGPGHYRDYRSVSDSYCCSTPTTDPNHVFSLADPPGVPQGHRHRSDADERYQPREYAPDVRYSCDERDQGKSEQ